MWSRAIVAEMRRTGEPHMYLDLRHLDGQFVRARFPRIYQTCLQYGVDLTTQLAPVHPAAHYAMGGVRPIWTGGRIWGVCSRPERWRVRVFMALTGSPVTRCWRA
jgi:succinate dehydrogenase/fumarate reductase flavoprotein subunit